jgi:hypothetical protein
MVDVVDVELVALTNIPVFGQRLKSADSDFTVDGTNNRGVIIFDGKSIPAGTYIMQLYFFRGGSTLAATFAASVIVKDGAETNLWDGPGGTEAVRHFNIVGITDSDPFKVTSISNDGLTPTPVYFDITTVPGTPTQKIYTLNPQTITTGELTVTLALPDGHGALSVATTSPNSGTGSSRTPPGNTASESLQLDSVFSYVDITVALANTPAIRIEIAPVALYVSSSGSDTTGTGFSGAPYASLNYAVDTKPSSYTDQYTAYVTGTVAGDTAIGGNQNVILRGLGATLSGTVTVDVDNTVKSVSIGGRIATDNGSAQ